jgi:hypothetical protein
MRLSSETRAQKSTCVLFRGTACNLFNDITFNIKPLRTRILSLVFVIIISYHQSFHRNYDDKIGYYLCILIIIAIIKCGRCLYLTNNIIADPCHSNLSHSLCYHSCIARHFISTATFTTYTKPYKGYSNAMNVNNDERVI